MHPRIVIVRMELEVARESKQVLSPVSRLIRRLWQTHKLINRILIRLELLVIDLDLPLVVRLS